jgi:predicted transposase YbfD/YdcC
MPIGILAHRHIIIKIMAKAAKTAIKTKDQKAAAEAKNWSKVIKAVRSPKTGAYTFKEAIVHKDKVKDFLSQK